MSIEIKDLTFTYSPKTPFQTVALDNFSLTINDGDFFGIIGTTGSGKSTLIQHLNALVKVQSGSVVVNGIDVSNKKTKAQLRGLVGMVFQYPEYQLFDESVEKDVGFGPKNLGFSKEEIAKKVKEAIELVGLNYFDIKDRSPFDLSGGQKRRVAIAGVLAMNPQILVLDEPTAGLDPKGRQEILKMIVDIKKAMGITVVMVSHNMDEIASLANRIAVLSKGKLLFEGTPEEVFKHQAELESIGLDLPTATRIANKLNARGFDLPDGIVTTEKLQAELVKLFKGDSHVS